MDNISKVKSKLLPIYIVKRNVNNTRTLNQRKINFQINFGKPYHINYKYFMPQGYHLSDASKPDVMCEYTDNGLNIPSITFNYVKNNNGDNHSQEELGHAKPIHVTYIDINSNHRIKSGSAVGRSNQMIDVTKQVPIPRGYHLCNDQKTSFKPGQYSQSIDLIIKHDPVKHQAKIVKNTTDESNHSDTLSSHKSNNYGSLNNSVKTLERNLKQYDSDLAVQLVHELVHHNINFFKKVIMQMFSSMKYKGISNLSINSHEHKISGVIKKYLYNNNQVNFTLIRAKYCDAHDQVMVNEVRDFVTSVMDHNCSKGIFITMSDFSSEAKKEAERHSIILISAIHLAKLMINYNVGVKPKRILKIVDLDKDFFN